MHFKLTTAILFVTFLSAVPVMAGNKRDITTLYDTKECIDCNLSNLRHTFTENDLRNVNVAGSNLSRSNFWSADLRNANFNRTNSRGTQFNATDLRGADFSYADVSGANFCAADLREVNWTGIIYSDSTKCLPNVAIDYVHKSSNNSSAVNTNSQNHNCPSNNSVVTKNQNSSRENIRNVRQTTEAIKDIIDLFE